MFTFYDKDGTDITSSPTEYCDNSSCLGEPWCSAWCICQETDKEIDKLFCQIDESTDLVTSLPDKHSQVEQSTSSAVPRPPPMAFVELPTKNKRIFALLKNDEQVKNARTEGISQKTASDTKYSLGMWEAWVNYRKKENNNTIGPIESLTTTTLQYWLSRFILEVCIIFILFLLK